MNPIISNAEDEKLNKLCNNCTDFDIEDCNTQTDSITSQVKVVLLSDFDDCSNMYCNSYIKVGNQEAVIAGRRKGDIICFYVPSGDYEVIVGNDLSSKVKSLNIKVKQNTVISIGIKSKFLSYDFFCR